MCTHANSQSAPHPPCAHVRKCQQLPTDTSLRAPLCVRARVGVESFYRSGLNAAMNARLSGQWGTLFPNMHIQCPARILYINGFKGLRQYLDWKVSFCL